VAMGDDLRKRLQAAGIAFEVVEGEGAPDAERMAAGSAG
jgi:hypothetical protein